MHFRTINDANMCFSLNTLNYNGTILKIGRMKDYVPIESCLFFIKFSALVL
jgi:hypothetical protein